MHPEVIYRSLSKPSKLRRVGVCVQFLSDKVDSSRVAKNAQSADDTDSFVAQEALVSELLSSVYIAYVHLEERNGDTGESVSQCHARVRETAGVDDDELGLLSRFVDSVDYGAFVVGLEVLDFNA